MKLLNLSMELKSITDAGHFSGYAAVFGNVDHGGDVIERGAFKEIMKRRNGKVVVLNQHRSSDPIGLAEVEQDDIGLKFEGDLILEAASARQAHALMKGGALDGMSIGYEVMPGGGEILKSGIRQLKALRLHEISPVTFGMNPLAGIESVKSAAAEMRSIREFEDFLRDVGGFSAQRAKAIAAAGWGQVDEDRDDPAALKKSLGEVFAGFRT